ncbi:MAG TPA: thioredoxin domain-containing protein, partial [Bacteroidetes bacterium]|nr:thioredoxin domain-containing protein [Bacteroidota bacterium]
WDMTEGGMNGAPKFPMPSNLHFLMDYTHQFTDTYTDSFIQLTLDKMAYGGIFDQLAGGFSRYSVDALWKAPHFEKMLYDNAQLLTIYAKAYKKYNNPLYLEILTKITDWLVHEMRDA